MHEGQSTQQDHTGHQTGSTVASLIKVTEAEGNIGVMFSLMVNLRDGREYVLSKHGIFGRAAAAFIPVSWDISTMTLQIAKAVTRHHDIHSLLFYDLDTLVFRIWTAVTPVIAPIKVIQSTSWMGANTSVAPDTGSHRDQRRKNNGRQYILHFLPDI